MPDVTLVELCEDALEEAGAGIPEIHPAQAANAAREDVLILDCREDAERIEHGVIPGDVHVALGRIPTDAEMVLFGGPADSAQKDTPIICYCAGGVRSLSAADALRQTGFSRAVSLAGGFAAWAAEGGPTAKPSRGIGSLTDDAAGSDF